MNLALIHTQILKQLAAVVPCALPESTLLDGVNIAVRPPLSAQELKQRLSFLADRTLVRVMEEELDPTSRKWLITETGKATLAAMPKPK